MQFQSSHRNPEIHSSILTNGYVLQVHSVGHLAVAPRPPSAARLSSGGEVRRGYEVVAGGRAVPRDVAVARSR